MTRHPCYVCGKNMTVASHRRVAFKVAFPHRTAEVGRDCCYRNIVTAGVIGVPAHLGRVFATLDQAKNWDAAQHMAALFPAVPPP